MINPIRIKYLYHSGFLVETDKNLLIFDYYQGHVDGLVKECAKNIFVFSSHSHPDHFNPVILEWQKDKPNIQYILSYEIKVPQALKNINHLFPDEKLEIGDLKIKVYDSTDIGVSFLVQVEGIRLFHAGDLNWWYWSAIGSLDSWGFINCRCSRCLYLWSNNCDYRSDDLVLY
ncbi:MAG TPA: hypothetical protein DEF42_16970 [Desulfosporosinus sp.]|nr:hypothetical protein [Desulfosporosinus sp.]